MSSAKKCDRCGKLYESSLHGATEVDLAISDGSTRNVVFCCGSYYSDLDLCPDCVESFKHWWSNETVVPITKKRGKKNGVDRETT